MKFSSISVIAATLATIAGGVTAAPAPRPFERVDIYSRTTAKEHLAQAKEHQTSIKLSQYVIDEARKKGQHTIAEKEQSSIELNKKYENRHIDAILEKKGGASGLLVSKFISEGTRDLSHKHLTELGEAPARRHTM